MKKRMFYPGTTGGKITANHDETDPAIRSSFGNHTFARYAGNIFDACAGPYLGTQTEAQYVSDTIDTTTANNSYSTGTVSNIISGAINQIK